MKNSKETLNEFLYEELLLEPTTEELKYLLFKLETDVDFYADIDNQEYRIIHTSVIDDIAQEEIKEITLDTYFQVEDLPWWIEIDWEKTSSNCIDADGYGHQFGLYDSEEHELGDHYFFRIN